MTRTVFALTYGTLLAGIAVAPAHAVKNITAVERAQLPTYCYAYLVDRKLAGQPEYSIPRSCGVGMNHLCGGYVRMLRAKHPATSPRERKSYASQAIGNFNYTLRHMSASCPIRADVENGLIEAKAIAGRLK